MIQRLLGFIRGRPSSSSDAEHSIADEKLSLRSLDIHNTSVIPATARSSLLIGNSLDLRHGYSNTALFALPLCFLFASVAQFASLLAFPLNGDATCGPSSFIHRHKPSQISLAFVVAWGGMAAQSGRLVGALIVIFELRKMGIGTCINPPLSSGLRE